MKIYTFQDKEVLDIIQNSDNNLYLPDFSKSIYLYQKPDLKELYNYLLNTYNTVNNCTFNGLVFGFADNENINDIKGFKEYMLNNLYPIKSLIEDLSKRDTFLLELEYKDSFLNYLPIGINDFQYIMPPIIKNIPPYKKDDAEKIKFNLSIGNKFAEKLPSGYTQVHVPYIKKENILNYMQFNIKN